MRCASFACVTEKSSAMKKWRGHCIELSAAKIKNPLKIIFVDLNVVGKSSLQA
jgi:hypothetical protein